ncbi:MAG: 2-oxoglutarate dehydrogenase, E2 component, dihydrolipoamide succinyltransferase [Actinomycetota bacterium]
MATKVEMPQMGESVVEGTILTWLKKEGDTVEVDEPLVEVSTDKVDTEIPSPIAGTLVKILVQEGDTVEVGSALAEIDEAGSGAAPPEKKEEEPQQQEEEETKAEAEETSTPSSGSSRPAAATTTEAAPSSQVVSPLVRRLAREHNLDLAQVRGTGAGGRVTREDVLAFIERGGAAPAAAPTDGQRAPARVAPPAAREATGERTEVQPVTHIRKRIAEHMTASLATSARAWNAIEVDMENIERLRASVREEFRAREGFSLTYLPFISRAVCDALQAHRVVNASISNDLSEATFHNYVNLGIAVATDYGLIVPVIKGAEALTIVGLARAIRDLGERARAKKLNPDEVGGSTFSITNPGPFGSYLSVPVINQPNVAIIGTEVVEKRVVVIDDMIAIRHRTFLSMSWDHRLLDGADAMQFLQRLKENVETWDFSHEI